jgi:hypothetical protein
MLSEAYGGEFMRKESFFECHKQFRESLHVRITNEDSAHNFLHHQGIDHFEFIPQDQSTRLIT